MIQNSFDKSWEKIYSKNQQLNIYPFYDLISFYNKTFKNINSVDVLEIGCGYGNNIELMSKFDHTIYGIDASKEVINKAKNRFKNKKNVNLSKQNFTNLKFKNNSFNFILNRESLTCVSKSNAIKAIGECYRVLKKNGVFYSTFVSNINSFDGKTIKNDLTTELKKNYSTVNQIRFYNILELYEIYKINKFKITELFLTSKQDYINKPTDILSYWTVVAKK